MVQTRKTAPAVPVDAVTPTRRSTRTKAVPVDAVTPRRCSTRTKAVRDSTKTLTPGQRFRDLLTVCEDHVPVADVVGDDCPVDDDVIVSPPPNKQTRNNQVVGEHNDSTITPVPPTFASVAATSLTQLEDDDPSDTAKDVNDDDKDGDDDRKLPAKRNAGKGDAMPSIPEGDYNTDEGDDDNDGGVDAFLNSYYDRDDPGDDNESFDAAAQDDRDDPRDDNELFDAAAQDGDSRSEVAAQDGNVEDESTANGAGEDDTTRWGEDAGSMDGVAAVVDVVDPSTLFLHAEEDAGSLLAFFADDSNYDDDGQREPVIDVDNE